MQNYTDIADNKMGYVISAPIFLLETEQKCSLCDVSSNVFLLATLNEPRETNDTSSLITNEVFILKYIESLPEDLYALITHQYPNYKIEHSFTAGADYYMTVCRCGGHYGDHYVSKQISETILLNPSVLRVKNLIDEGSWIIPCNYSYGSFDIDIFLKEFV